MLNGPTQVAVHDVDHEATTHARNNITVMLTEIMCVGSKCEWPQVGATVIRTGNIQMHFCNIPSSTQLLKVIFNARVYH